MNNRYYSKEFALVKQTNMNLPNLKLFSSDFYKNTRNINNLYYFVEKNISHSAKYESIEKCKDMYTNFIYTNNNLKSMCEILNNKYDVVLIENSFFNIFIKNEYMIDTYNTNKMYFFEQLLLEKGFILKELNENCNLNILHNDCKININKNDFNEFINNFQNELNNNDPIYKKIQILGLPFDNSVLTKYDKIIYDDNKFTEHLNVIRFMKSDRYIDKKFKEFANNTFAVKHISNIYNKIKLLRTIVTKFNIDYFNITYKIPDLRLIDICDADWMLYKKVFRISKKKPSNFYELIIAIVGMIKNITCNEIIKQKKFNIDKKQFIYYTFNFDIFCYHLELHSFSNPKYEHISEVIIGLLNIDVIVDEFIL